MAFGLENSFFTFYYVPYLCVGSFCAIVLGQALSKRMKNDDELHIITTHPNSYENQRVKASEIEVHGNITIHRISVPSHKTGIFSQARTFVTYPLTSLTTLIEIPSGSGFSMALKRLYIPKSIR